MRAPMLKRLVLLCFVATIVMFSATSFAQSPLKIGVLSGLTGMASKWNHYQNNGARLAQEEFAAAGVSVELVFEDSQTIGSKALSGFNKLVDVDKVDAVFGTDFGFALAPVIPVAQRKRKLFVANSLPLDTYCKQSTGFFFSVCSQFVYLPQTFERFFVKHPEIKRAAMFVFDDPEWGHSYQTIWTALAQKYGVEITDTFVLSEPTPEFRTLLAKALTHKPDLLLLAHEPLTFSKAVAGSGFKGPILSANNYLEVLDKNEDVGDIINRVVIADPIISAEFAKAYEARFHEPPILEAYSGYEGVRLIVKALQVNRDHPERAVPQIKYKGVGGEIDFTTPSCAGNMTEWGLFKIQNRRLVPVD